MKKRPNRINTISEADAKIVRWAKATAKFAYNTVKDGMNIPTALFCASGNYQQARCYLQQTESPLPPCQDTIDNAINALKEAERVTWDHAINPFKNFKALPAKDFDVCRDAVVAVSMVALIS